MSTIIKITSLTSVLNLKITPNYMNLENLLNKPLWQMTAVVVDATSPKYVYGLSGIAQLFGCSIPTANRIKKSGKIDKAIKQIGRKIIVDAELALELAGRKTGGRR